MSFNKESCQYLVSLIQESTTYWRFPPIQDVSISVIIKELVRLLIII